MGPTALGWRQACQSEAQDNVARACYGPPHTRGWKESHKLQGLLQRRLRVDVRKGTRRCPRVSDGSSLLGAGDGSVRARDHALFQDTGRRAPAGAPSTPWTSGNLHCASGPFSVDLWMGALGASPEALSWPVLGDERHWTGAKPPTRCRMTLTSAWAYRTIEKRRTGPGRGREASRKSALRRLQEL